MPQPPHPTSHADSRLDRMHGARAGLEGYHSASAVRPAPPCPHTQRPSVPGLLGRFAQQAMLGVSLAFCCCVVLRFLAASIVGPRQLEPNTIFSLVERVRLVAGFLKRAVYGTGAVNGNF